MPIQIEHLTHTYLPGSPFSAVAVHDVNAVYGNLVTRDDVDFFDSLGAFVDFGLFQYLTYSPVTEKELSRRSWQNFKMFFAFHVARNLLIIRE